MSQASRLNAQPKRPALRFSSSASNHPKAATSNPAPGCRRKRPAPQPIHSARRAKSLARSHIFSGPKAFRLARHSFGLARKPTSFTHAPFKFTRQAFCLASRAQEPCAQAKFSRPQTKNALHLKPFALHMPQISARARPSNSASRPFFFASQAKLLARQATSPASSPHQPLARQSIGTQVLRQVAVQGHHALVAPQVAMSQQPHVQAEGDLLGQHGQQ